jgi:hypothetical protein
MSNTTDIDLCWLLKHGDPSVRGSRAHWARERLIARHYQAALAALRHDWTSGNVGAMHQRMTALHEAMVPTGDRPSCFVTWDGTGSLLDWIVGAARNRQTDRGSTAARDSPDLLSGSRHAPDQGRA